MNDKMNFKSKSKYIVIYHIFIAPKTIVKYPMKFPDTPDGFATSFKLCNKSVDART